MVAITGTNSTTPSMVQLNLMQSRLQQARMDAAQAQNTVNTLQDQLNQAQLSADNREAVVQDLKQRNQQTNYPVYTVSDAGSSSTVSAPATQALTPQLQSQLYSQPDSQFSAASVISLGRTLAALNASSPQPGILLNASA